MKQNILGTDVVTQVAFLVNDIEKTAQDYADFLGVEKPMIKITGDQKTAGTRYKGEPTDARAKLAFFHVGPQLDIELIEPDKEPSTWREELDAHGEGFHHIAFVIKDMEDKKKKMQEAGFPLIQAGEYKNGRNAYMDTKEKLKIIIELLENDE